MNILVWNLRLVWKATSLFSGLNETYTQFLPKAGLVVGPLLPSVCVAVRNTFGVPSLCNL